MQHQGQHGRSTIRSAGLRRRRIRPVNIFESISGIRGPLSAPLLALSTRTMSQTHFSASSPSNFQSIFSAALDTYEKKTESNLLTHPLAAQLQSCDSPTAILSVFQELIQRFDPRHRSDQRLTNWLGPTINVLYAFSATIGPGIGLVSLNSLLFVESMTRLSFLRYFRLRTWSFRVSVSFFW